MEHFRVVLAIDAGNTRVKWALRDGDAWIASGAVATGDAAQLGAAWEALPPPESAIASNVAGPAVEAALAAACEARAVPLTVIRSRSSQLGVVNGYDHPGQLGADRWAALIAAHALGGGAKLVVNAGTALTIDALEGDGHFVGGLIVPGPALMRRALDRGTAGLRLTEGAFDPFPRSTPDAITSGALQACAGAIGRMREALARRAGASVRVVLSGGAAGEIAPHLPMPAAIHENLVLDGLLAIARNR